MKAEAVDLHPSRTRLLNHLSAEHPEARVQPFDLDRRSKGDCTLDSLVRELLRPLLKDWLDLHLALIVERCVNAEIERIVKA